MAALRINILANYAGQSWMAIAGVLFLPLYVQLLGMESFGLIGLLLSFQAILQLFDFGIGGATNRELSRRVHNPALANDCRDLVRSAEILIWLIAVGVSMVMWAGSAGMAEKWLHLDGLSAAEASNAIALMGLAIGLLWPSSFYAQCLSGLERQLELNVINVLFTTLRFAGVVPALLWIAPTIEVFLWWQAMSGAAQSLVTAASVSRYLPQGSRRARCSLDQLRGHRRFAGGLFLISLLAIGLTQIDRLTLTTLQPLDELGYYTLAASVASGLGKIVQPMFNAIYPRFSRLVEHGEGEMLGELYHLSSHLLAVVVAAVSAILVVFSRDVLMLWTGDGELADKVAVPMALLVGGTALNGLLHVPYALQLAHGRTRLVIRMYVVALGLGIPFCGWAVTHLGMRGAALYWLTLNVALVVIGVPLMHRDLLRGQLSRWALQDTVPPFLAALSTALLLEALLPPATRSATGVLCLGLATAATVLASALTSGHLRRQLLKHLR